MRRFSATCVTTVTPMKRGLKATLWGAGAVGVGLVTTVTPMKRGLKVVVAANVKLNELVTTVTPMKRGLKDLGSSTSFNFKVR